jgi:hypothetical protein
MRHQAENVRSLVKLHASGVGGRVINLLRVWEAAAAAGTEIEAPFFENPVLNRGFLLKHRLRHNEAQLFGRNGGTETKLIIPFDIGNLAAGGRSMFVGEPGFYTALSETVGARFPDNGHDRRVLEVLNKLPSFDPFLLRECLAKEGFHPSPAYFELPSCDAKAMEAFVAEEIISLVSKSLTGKANVDGLRRLVKKMLASRYDRDMEPLRHTLRLSETDFREGMFCWKGFLYYKWMSLTLRASIAPMLVEMKTAKLQRSVSVEERTAIKTSLMRIGRALIATVNDMKAITDEYDRSYRALTVGDRPVEFRDFLLSAPHKFMRLGELMGQAQHLVSFWRYRSRGGAAAVIPAEEYLDMIREFETTLSINVDDLMAA